MKKVFTILQLLVFIVMLTGCGLSDNNKTKFKAALESMQEVSNYSVTITNTLRDKDSVVGEVTENKVRISDGVIEYTKGDVVEYYYLGEDNTAYKLKKVRNVYVPDIKNGVDPQQDFGIIDFSKRYKVEKEGEMVVSDLLGIDESTVTLNSDGMIKEIYTKIDQEIGGGTFETIIKYDKYNESIFEIDAITPEEMIQIYNDHIKQFGDDYYLHEDYFTIKHKGNTTLNYDAIEENMSFQFEQYSYVFETTSRFGTASESVLGGQKDLTLEEALALEVFYSVHEEQITTDNLDGLINFVNRVYH